LRKKSRKKLFKFQRSCQINVFSKTEETMAIEKEEDAREKEGEDYKKTRL
jgi:hypothetical protein